MECAYLYSRTARCSFSYYAWTRRVTGTLTISALGRTVYNTKRKFPAMQGQTPEAFLTCWESEFEPESAFHHSRTNGLNSAI